MDDDAQVRPHEGAAVVVDAATCARMQAAMGSGASLVLPPQRVAPRARSRSVSFDMNAWRSKVLHVLSRDVDEGLPSARFIERAGVLLRGGLCPTDGRLVHLAKQYLPALVGVVGMKDLRRAAERARGEPRASVSLTSASVPADWPHRAMVAGKRAAILGGDKRPARLERLKAAFGFASIEWMENCLGGFNHLESMERRLVHGSVDLVILVRAFTSHTITDRVFALRLPPTVTLVLSDTYGVLQVRRAFERFLGKRAA